MKKHFKYLIGVDGGGSGTRILVTDLNKQVLAQARGAPSALGQGVHNAWPAIMTTIDKCMPAFDPEDCAIGIGISGANNSSWKELFISLNPGFPFLKVESDAMTTLRGAHMGSAGCVIAIGTGTVGMAIFPSGEVRTVAGWGFPSGDEGSGSWLGLQAINMAQKVLDGRLKSGPLVEAILGVCGRTKNDFLLWLGLAAQFQYATIAPLIFAHAKKDRMAKNLLKKSGDEIYQMSKALDPSKKLPFALSGSIGEKMIPYLPSSLRKRAKKPIHDSAQGAIDMIFESLFP